MNLKKMFLLCLKTLRTLGVSWIAPSFFCEAPRDYGRQGNQYSNYKHHCTMKCLIAVMPSGGTCFVSDLFEGGIDDVKIFEQSGILDHIHRGDTLLVDKGFTIKGSF